MNANRHDIVAIKNEVISRNDHAQRIRKTNIQLNEPFEAPTLDAKRIEWQHHLKW